MVVDHRSGHMRYYALNPDYNAYKPPKRLLDRIRIWPEMKAASTNDDLKDQRRLTEDWNARPLRGRKAVRPGS